MLSLLEVHGGLTLLGPCGVALLGVAALLERVWPCYRSCDSVKVGFEGLVCWQAGVHTWKRDQSRCPKDWPDTGPGRLPKKDRTSEAVPEPPEHEPGRRGARVSQTPPGRLEKAIIRKWKTGGVLIAE